MKLIPLKREIFDEMLTINGRDASYCCLKKPLGDFHRLKAELTKQRNHAIQFEAYKKCLIS